MCQTNNEATDDLRYHDARAIATQMIIIEVLHFHFKMSCVVHHRVQNINGVLHIASYTITQPNERRFKYGKKNKLMRFKTYGCEWTE